MSFILSIILKSGKQGVIYMGDKSPKSTKKQASQKQAKSDGAQQKKKSDEAAKQAARTKK